MSSWKGLRKRYEQFNHLRVELIGIAADTPERLQLFHYKLDLPFTLLSDPQLRSAEALDIPIAGAANFVATAALHPVLLTYERKSYLQPAVFVWLRDGTLAYEWRQTSKLMNLFGATGRPSPEQIVEIARQSLPPGIEESPGSFFDTE